MVPIRLPKKIPVPPLPNKGLLAPEDIKVTSFS